MTLLQISDDKQDDLMIEWLYLFLMQITNIRLKWPKSLLMKQKHLSFGVVSVKSWIILENKNKNEKIEDK